MIILYFLMLFFPNCLYCLCQQSLHRYALFVNRCNMRVYLHHVYHFFVLFRITSSMNKRLNIHNCVDRLRVKWQSRDAPASQYSNQFIGDGRSTYSSRCYPVMFSAHQLPPCISSRRSCPAPLLNL